MGQWRTPNPSLGSTPGLHLGSKARLWSEWVKVLKDLNWRANLFWYVVVFAGGTVTLAAVVDLKLDEITGNFLLWLGLLFGALIGERLALRIQYRTQTQYWAFSDAFLVALLWLFSWEVVIGTAILSSVIGDVSLKKPWVKVVFNAGLLSVSMFAAAIVVQVVGPISKTYLHWSGFGALAGVTVYYLVNSVLMCTMIGFLQDESPYEVYKHNAQIILFSFASLASLGSALALVHTVNPLATLLLVVPIFGVYYTYNNYLRLQSMTTRTMEKLSDILERRDEYTACHSRRVAELSIKIAEAMKVSEGEKQVIEIAGRVHDIGKIGVSNEVLYKPGVYVPKEYATMQQHPTIGFEILNDIREYREAARIIYCHHERWDGSGYPRGLRSEGIPLGARILAIADAYDAMTTLRPYRKPLTHSEAVNEIRSHAGTQFDPAAVEAFLSVASGASDVADLFTQAASQTGDQAGTVAPGIP